MLTCPKCGSNNPLGRVFCSACGSRLDFTGLSSNEIVGSARPSIWRRIRWGWVAAGLGALALLLVVLACWPKSAPLGEEGTRIGGNRVTRQFSAVSKLRRGQSLGLNFEEKDLNGYLRFEKAPKLDLESLSVELGPRRMRVRMVQTLTVLDVGPIRFSPRISRDVLIVPARSRLLFRKGSIGHLPLVGPFKGIAIKSVRRKLDREPEWQALRDTADIRMESRKLFVLVEK